MARTVTSPFESLGLTAQLLRATELAGYLEATPVQVATIPAVLAGRDVRARAETGSGNTAAFGLPRLQRLWEQPRVHSAVHRTERGLVPILCRQHRGGQLRVVPQHVPHPAHVAVAGEPSRKSARAPLAERVVGLALLGVGEDVVRALHLLEVLLGLGIPRVRVGVVLPRE